MERQVREQGAPSRRAHLAVPNEIVHEDQGESAGKCNESDELQEGWLTHLVHRSLTLESISSVR